MSTYHTIAGPIEGVDCKEKGSKFITYLFPCKSEEEYKLLLNRVKEQHPKATHHCYAYRLGAGGLQYRSNDDGEPSGTAGLPILNQLISAKLVNVLCIVVRYYGGTKLGVPGLIKAYKESAKGAVEMAEVIEEIVKYRLIIKGSYEAQHKIFSVLQRLQADILKTEMSESITITAELPRSNKEKIPELMSGIPEVLVKIID